VASVRPVTDYGTIRRASLDDIPAAAGVRAAALPDIIVTAEGMLRWHSSMPATCDLLMLVAEVDGAVVGWATGRRLWERAEPGGAMADVVVHPDHQGRGLGGRLAARVRVHLEALSLSSVRASSTDTPAATALARRHGMAEIGSERLSAVDPRTVEPLPVPDGTRMVPFRGVSDPRPVYELDLEVSRDIPGESGVHGWTLEDWTAQFWHTPGCDPDLSLVAYVDGELAAVTMLRFDAPSGRAMNALTGTRSAYRGRGLARLLKTHSLQLAGQAGATLAITSNEDRNAAMLAVNEALGYRPFSRRVEWEWQADRDSCASADPA
jgi:GNAT superfamily N-acetyltransferase